MIKRTILTLAMVAMVAMPALAEVNPPVKRIEKEIPNRAIYNVCTSPDKDYNNDGFISPEDSHIDLYHGIDGSIYYGILLNSRCDHDYSKAMAIVFMVSNTTRRLFDSRLFDWQGCIEVINLGYDTGDNSQALQDSLDDFDEWIKIGWEDACCEQPFIDMYIPLTVKSWRDDLPAMECGQWPMQRYQYDPFQNVSTLGNEWITGYSIDPQEDYNQDGFINYGDRWLQVSWPEYATGNIDIWITYWDNTTGQINRQMKLGNYAKPLDGYIRRFMSVSTEQHDIHTCIEIVIPDNEDYAGDLLAYCLWSEDGVAYETMAPQNTLPIEY